VATCARLAASDGSSNCSIGDRRRDAINLIIIVSRTEIPRSSLSDAGLYPMLKPISVTVVVPTSHINDIISDTASGKLQCDCQTVTITVLCAASQHERRESTEFRQWRYEDGGLQAESQTTPARPSHEHAFAVNWPAASGLRLAVADCVQRTV
jgi:hypothetical protein